MRLEELESRLAPASLGVNVHLQGHRFDNVGALPTATTSVVFFESNVAGVEVLRQGLGQGTEAVVLDSTGNGLREMAAFLQDRHNLESIGVVAHGASGTLLLGTGVLDAQSLDSYAPELAAIKSALAPGGELDLWSCDVAAGQGGETLVHDLAAATGAGVAAADHVVGSSALGGSWKLDVQVGGARGDVPFGTGALKGFHELLGVWSSGAAMATAREFETATLLNNGKVLVAGGLHNGGDLASAELYDPASNTWTAAGPMATARYLHTATLLANGEVLVTGGIGPSGILSSAELYNPQTNSWSAAASLPSARDQHTATLLGNGLVLVAGGLGNSGVLASAELYNPTTNTWSDTASMTTARVEHSATLLGNGQVLVAGGLDNKSNALGSAELYDPLANTWSSTGSLATPRYSHTATLLGNGKVLVAGGLGKDSLSPANAELYDPISRTWSSGGSMITPPNEDTATLLPNGQVLVAGGLGNNSLSLSTVQLYDPVSNSWSAGAPLGTPRAIHAATLLKNGQLLVAGGDNNGISLATAEVYNASALVQPTFVVSAVGGVYTGSPYDAVAFVTGIGGAILASPGDPSLSYTYYVGATTSGLGSPIAPTNAGTYTVVAHWASTNPIYASADSPPVTFTITPAPITVTADAQSKPFGAADPTLTYQITKGTLASVDSFTGALTRTPGESPGTYPIKQGTLSLNANYILTFIGSNLVVTPTARLAITDVSDTSPTAGLPVTFVVTAVDSSGRAVPGYTGTVQLTSTDPKATVNGSPLPISYTFVAGDAGTHTFTAVFATAGGQTITATDQAHAFTTTTAPIAVTLPTTQYILTITGSNRVTAGGSFLITVQAADQTGKPVTRYTGPSTVTIATIPVDPLGNLPGTVTLNGSGFGILSAMLKTAGSYTVTASADGFTGSTNLLVVPAAPATFKITTPMTAPTGLPFNITVTAFDQFGNVATGYSGHVHFTSSDLHASLPVDSAVPNGSGVFSVTLNTGGDQTITATDKTTSPAITGTSGPITPPLTVTGFAPTATGFTVSFNKPFNPADLTMYGADVHTVQDVTLVGAHVGAISGSLILDPSNMSLTFIATQNSLALQNGLASVVLPDDAYTATLVSGSGANGFLDALGTSLDGNGNGGHDNFTATFSTHYQASATPVLSIPDFARGPDGANAIKVPNDVSQGIPITLYNAAKVVDVTFTLTYNPALLTVTGATNADASDHAASFTMLGAPTIVDATHAIATFHFSDLTAQSGTVVLGDIQAVVPNSAASVYKAKEILQLGGITINQGAVTGAVAANGVHVNAYSGDVTGNGTVDVLDLATANNVSQGKAAGFAAYQFLDPAIIGDVANDFSIDAGDISTIAAFSVHLPAATMPPIPTGLTITPVGADPTLSLGQPAIVGSNAGGTISVPVMLDHPHPVGSTGMTEAVLALTFDPKVLSVSAADITLGDIPDSASGWQISSEVDQATGQIGIAIFSTTAITATQAGSLVNIVFHIVPGVTAQASSVQLTSRVMPNGHEFATQVDDAQGQLVLSPGVDSLVVPTGASATLAFDPSDTRVLQTATVISQHDLVESGNPEETAGAPALDQETDVSIDLAISEAATGETTPARILAAAMGARDAVAIPVNQTTIASTQIGGQVFLVGGSPLLNLILVNNGQELDAASWLAPAAGQRTDAGGDSAQISAPDIASDALLRWLSTSSRVQAEDTQTDSTTAAAQFSADQIAVVNETFTRQWQETSDFSDVDDD
jgi:N-acetylneuraminic acid mutarotase